MDETKTVTLDEECWSFILSALRLAELEMSKIESPYFEQTYRGVRTELEQALARK